MLINLYRQFIQRLTVGKLSERRRNCRAKNLHAGIVEHLESRCLLSGTALVYAGVGTETLSPDGQVSQSLSSSGQMPAVTPGSVAGVSQSSTGLYQGAGLVIVPTFDTSITTDTQAATIEATINQVIAEYEAAFSDPITVNIDFKEMSTGLGQSNWYYYTIPYSTFRSELAASATTANDATALANLPNTSTDPVLGQSNMIIKPANATTLDHSFVGPSSDGTVSLNTSICNLDRSVVNPSDYDLAGVTAHEIDEVLGMGSALNVSNVTNVFPQDLFRYDQNGVRSFTANTSAQAFFSLNGTTDLAQFNQTGSGDYGDWRSGASAPQVQDAFITPGVSLNPGVEFVNLDVQGWHYVNYASKLTVTNTTVNQGTAATFEIALTQASSVDVTVNYATSDGTATTAAGDYTSTSGTITIPAGSLTTTVTVPTFPDAGKPSSTFFLNLSNATNSLIASGTGAATVIKPGVPALSQTQFTPIGPGPISGSTVTGGTVSGRITGTATDPTNANIIYIATAGGGVWKTTDGGASWIPLTDNQPTLAMGAIALAASKPSVIYAGTGEANNTIDSQPGLGVLVSQDGGATWTLTGTNPFNHEAISKIVVDPNDPSKAWVAASYAGGGTPGIYQTTNYGATWNLVYSTGNSLTSFSDIALDSLSTPGLRTLFAAVGTTGGTAFGSASNGVYVSYDDGASWGPAGNFPSGIADGRISVAIAPTNDNIIYASIENPTTRGLLAMEKSTDGGTTWNALASTPNYMGNQGAYAQTLAVSPADPNVVFAGGDATVNGFVESTDGGLTWVEIGIKGTNGIVPHSNSHAIVFDANGKMFDATNAGLFRLDVADTAGFAWSDLNSNLNITDVDSIALDPTNPNIAYVGSQGDGTEKFTGSSVWQSVAASDGGAVEVDPNNLNTVYHEFNYGSNFFQRSSDGGITWTSKTSGINLTNLAAFYPPFIIDPTNTNRLLLGTDRLYESLNNGDSWSAISAPGTGNWSATTPITAIATSGNTIYAAAGGYIYVTTNDGASWTQTAPEGSTTGVSFTNITLNPTTPTTAYAVSFGHVVMTTNGGATWSDISGNLPLIPINAIQVDPRTNAIYVGTANGVEVSSTNGTSWQPAGAGLPNADVFSLALNPQTNILGVGTHGRGVWELSLASATSVVPQILSINLVGTSTSNSQTVSWTATFNEPVTGVNPTDFSLVKTGTIGAVLTQVTPVSPSVYTITVSGITGNGTLALNLVNNGTIQDLSGKKLVTPNGAASFTPPATFATGNSPYSVIEGDLNGDGKPDLVVANFLTSTVSVLIGNGDGTFQAQQTLATGKYPISVTLGDVNGDGKLDIISANSNGSSVSVLLGNGNGTFQAQQTYAVGLFPDSAKLSDLNGDGKPDLVVSNKGNGTISVLLGNGNGTFQSQQSFSTGTRPDSVALGDVNGDGRTDLVVANYNTNTVSVFLGNGNGTFGAQQTYATGSSPQSVKLQDLNGDGKADIIVADYGNSSVSILFGNGNGTFQAQQTLATGSHPYSVAVSDVNGDGVLDIVAANEGSNSASVLLGNGDGTFQPQQTFAAGSHPSTVVVGDLNGDNKADLVISNTSTKSVSVLLGNGLGNFKSQVLTEDQVAPYVVSINRTTPTNAITNAGSVTFTATFSEPVMGVNGTSFAPTESGTVNESSITVTPVNGSVYTITVSGITGSGSLGLNLLDTGSIRDLAGNPLTTVNAPVSFANQQLISTGASPASVLLGDVNGDGIPDLITVSAGLNDVSVMLGNGNGTFQLGQVFPTGIHPFSVSVADLNGDGKPDLVVANPSAATVSVLMGNGNGTFQSQQTVATGSYPRSMSLVDVNGDGKPDLVVVNANTNDVNVLLGNGNGTFQAGQSFATGIAPLSISVGDLNGDGKPDIIVSNSGNASTGNTISVLMGNGNGTFQSQQTITVGLGPDSVTLSDVNGDGKPDIIVANRASNTVSVLMANGNGTFQSQQTFATGMGPTQVTMADLNEDGKQDLIVSNGGSGPLPGNTVSVLMGNGNGTFQPQQTFAAGLGSVITALGDVNGDGRPDLVVANYLSNTLSLLLANGNGNFTGQSYTIDSGPVVTSVSITPTNPTTNQLLTANVMSNDPAGLTVTYTYQWQKNGVNIPGATGATLDLSIAGNGDKGDSIDVIVIPSDGSITGAAVTSSSVPVVDTAPVISSVTISPSSPTTNQLLTATVVSSDADNDPVTYSYQWKKNGTNINGATGSTLDLSVAGNGDKGDIITVTVTPNDGTLTGTAVTASAVTIADSAPVISSVTISPTNPTTNQLLTATVVSSDADNDPVTYTYQWKKNGTNIAGATGSTLDLSVAGNGDKADVITVTVTPNDGTLNGAAVTASSVTVADTAPIISSVTIAPSNPTTNQILTATVVSSDVDNDSVTYTYQWKKNGTNISGATGSTLDLSVAGNGDKGDVITVTVTPNDGTLNGTAVTSASVTIVNSTPVISSVTITPSSPTTNQTLTATVVSSDADNDPVTYSYQWKKNGTNISGATSSTLDLSVAGNGDKGDVITVTVTPNDGTVNGTPVTASSVTVADSAPVISSVTITPASPTTNQLLNATVVSSDADNDPVTYSYQWKKNGTNISGATASTLDLSVSGNGDKGDVITVTVTPNDGVLNGVAVTSSPVTVADTAPAIGSVTITPVSPTTNQTLTANIVSSDADNDPVTYTYQWKKNGTNISGATGSTLNLALAGNGDKGDVITVTVTPNDGTLNGTAVTATSVTIVNSAPVISSVTITPTSPTTNQLLTATVVGSDADNDPVTYTYQWKKNGTNISGATGTTLDLSVAGNGDQGDVITVTVTPNDGTINGIAVTASSVTVAATVPVISSVTVSPTNPTTNQTLTASVVSSDADNLPVTYTYQWKKNGTNISGATASTLDLSVAGNGDKGDVITVTVTPNDGVLNGAAVTSSPVTIADTAPVISSVTITPVSATTNQTLTANVVSSDADNDPVTYTYQWKKNGAIINGATGSTLNLSLAGNGDKGDIITVTVTPNDGTLNGTSVTATSVSVVNSAPVISSVLITPANPTTNQLLTATVVSSDADNDPVTYTYQWKKNGTNLSGAIGATLDLSVAGNGDKGDVISVTVTPNDGTLNGTAVTASATVADTASVISSVTISPTNPTTNQILTATVVSSDVDNDLVTYTYQWKKNGTNINGATGSTLDLSVAGNGDKGDVITVAVTPNDGTLNGNVVTSASVTVADTAPVVTSVTISPSSPTTNQTLTATVVSSDADNDLLTYGYQWKKNGTNISGATSSTLNLSVASNGDKGDVITVMVTPNDGTLNGTTVTSPSVTVADSAPMISSVTVTPTNPTTNQTLTATVVGSDVDNDPVTYSYQWKKNGVNISGATGTTLDLSVTGNGNKGDVITVTVTPNDGTLNGVAVTSAPTTVVDTAPVISSVTISPNNPTTNQTMSATVVSSDIDNDPVTYTYQWQKNGVNITGATGATLDLSVPGNGDKGDVITVTVTPHDGTLNGTAVTSSSLTVIDTVPSIAPQVFSLLEKSANQTTVGTVVATDPDPGDTKTFSITGGNSLGAFAMNAGGVITVADTTQLLLSTNPTFTLTVKVTDSSGQSASTTVTINLTTNAPVLSGIETTSVVYSGTGTTPVTSTLAISDKNSLTIAHATVSISSGFQAGQDSLSFGDTLKIKGSWDSTLGILTLVGTDSLANYQAALKTIQFQSTGPNTSPRTISFQVNDGVLDSNIVSRVVDPVPHVLSIIPVSTTPVIGSIVQFNVMFSEPVTGVVPANFSLAESGMTGGSIAVSGSGASYTVTVSSLSGGGTIGLNLTNFSSIVDSGNNPVTAGLTGGVVTLLQVGGPISLSGTTLKISGTDGNDFTTISEGATLLVVINSVSYPFIPSQVTSIVETASSGTDSTTVTSLNSNTPFTSTTGSGNDSVIVSTTVFTPVKLIGGTGNVTLTGGSGNDTLIGGTANSVLSDGNGNDKLIGGTGNTTFTVGAGMDTLIGGSGNNTFNGGVGNDTFFSGTNNNVINAGSGINRFYLSAPTTANAKDTLTSTGSTNTLNLTNFTDGLTFSLAKGSGTAQVADPSNGFTLDVQNNAFSTVFLGGNAGTTNIVTGNSTLNTKIIGGLGNNTIAGGSGNDFLIGGFENSLLTDGNGNDTLYGGNGNSTLNAGNGNDTLVGGLGNSSLSAGNGNDKLTGGSGNNTFSVGSGIDILIGGNANNTFTGGSGNDTFYSGTQNNVISTGGGVNRIYLAVPTISNAKDTLTSTGSTNTLNLTNFTDGLTFSLANGSGVSQTVDPNNGFQLDLQNNAFSTVLLGGNAGTANVVTGNSTLGTKIVGGLGNNTIAGGSGNDFLIGGYGNTLVTDGNGNDTLYGGNANSTLVAGNGNDKFVGGLGNTLMSAGNGNDKLIGGNGNSTITAGDGNDILIGGLSNNTLTAGNGNDTLYAGTLNNVIGAGTGTSKFILAIPTTTNSKDTLSDAGSTSTLNLSTFSDGLTFSLAKGNGTAQVADPNNGFQLVVQNNAFNTILLGGNAGTTNVVTGNSTLGTKIVGGSGNNTLAGGSGNDFLIGGIGNTLITDGNGNDTLYGGNGNSTLKAGDGNDTLVAGLGGSSLSAGNGNDKLIGGSSNSTLTAGNGNDTLYGGTGNNVISGGSGVNRFILSVPTIANAKDTLTDTGTASTLNLTAFTDGLTFSLAIGSGTAQTADLSNGFKLDIQNNAFNTVLLGGNAGTTNVVTGNSTLGTKIVGGLGNNTISGGSGNDFLIGGFGNTLITDGNGNDTLYGGNANSTLVAGNGNDKFVGGLGNSSLTAGNGNDTLIGGSGNNTLKAGNGNDSLYGGTLSNVISAGTGTSRFILAIPTIANAKDTLTDAGSTSTLNLTAFTDGLTFSLAKGSGVAQTADPSNGLQLDIQNNSFSTVLLGGNAGTTNVVTGNSTLGTKIVGGFGNNTLAGGSGNDFLIGGYGNTLITDGNGNDTLYGGNANTTFTAGNGNDTLVGGLGNTSMSAGNGNDKLVGGNGNSTIIAGNGNDTLIGGLGNNTLTAGNGNDTLYGGTLSNVISAGTGTSKFILSAPTVANIKDTLTDGGSTSTLNLTSFTDGLTFSLALGSGTAQAADPSKGFQLDIKNNVFNAVLLGGNAGTTNVVTGNSTLGTKIIGGNGNNVLVGGAGNDTLIGGPGRDILISGLGTDTLEAGTGGQDILIGGTISFASPLTAIIAIENEWASADTYANRVADIRGSSSQGLKLNGTNFLTSIGTKPTVTLGTTHDTLLGGGANDWFWATSLDTTNRQSTEVLN